MALPPLLHRVIQTVRSRSLFQRRHHIVVAISGGPDSVALLSMLHHLQARWELTLSAVHCNYGLRGAESEEDQQFVEAFCQELGVPLHVRRVGLRNGGRHTSPQAEARDLRYQVMREIAKECGADRIAVGHTANDQAETVLLWMLRGAGLTGLSGMPAFREQNVIRPLYETTRQEILGYLGERGLAFREDSSNFTPRYLRNRVRKEVLPILTQLVPSSVSALCRLADICREDDRYLDEQGTTLSSSAMERESTGGWAIDLVYLRNLPSTLQRRCIRNLFRQDDDRSRSPSLQAVDRILRLAAIGKSGTGLDVKGGRIVVGNHRLRFIPLYARAVSHAEQSHDRCRECLSVPGAVVWAGTGQRLQVQQQARSQMCAPLGKGRIVVDADRVSQPLVIRSWLPGDRFHPAGMNGHSKKLQDFFTDLKIPLAVRSRIPLVVAPEGILWVVGYRQDERWAPIATTKRCLVLTSEGPA